MPSKVKKTGKSKSFHVSFLAVFTLVKVPQIIRRHVQTLDIFTATIQMQYCSFDDRCRVTNYSFGCMAIASKRIAQPTMSLLVPHVPSRSLRSSHAPRLAVPRTRNSFCQPCFLCRCTDRLELIAGQCRQLGHLSNFKKRLKTHIFHCVICNVLATERLCISLYQFL